MKKIDQVMQMINWKKDMQTQLVGIELAKDIDEISIFIQPTEYENKAVWENCAIILSKKTDVELEPYLDSLLEWLQDINWPGAIKVTERLKAFSSDKLRISIEKAVAKANKMSCEEGLMWLDYLSELLDNNLLASSLSIEVLTLLKNHYHNWASWYSE